MKRLLSEKRTNKEPHRYDENVDNKIPVIFQTLVKIPGYRGFYSGCSSAQLYRFYFKNKMKTARGQTGVYVRYMRICDDGEALLYA